MEFNRFVPLKLFLNKADSYRKIEAMHAACRARGAPEAVCCAQGAQAGAYCLPERGNEHRYSE